MVVIYFISDPLCAAADGMGSAFSLALSPWRTYSTVYGKLCLLLGSSAVYIHHRYQGLKSGCKWSLGLQNDFLWWVQCPILNVYNKIYKLINSFCNFLFVFMQGKPPRWNWPNTMTHSHRIAIKRIKYRRLYYKHANEPSSLCLFMFLLLHKSVLLPLSPACDGPISLYKEVPYTLPELIWDIFCHLLPSLHFQVLFNTPWLWDKCLKWLRGDYKAERFLLHWSSNISP